MGERYPVLDGIHEHRDGSTSLVVPLDGEVFLRAVESPVAERMLDVLGDDGVCRVDDAGIPPTEPPVRAVNEPEGVEFALQFRERGLGQRGLKGRKRPEELVLQLLLALGVRLLQAFFLVGDPLLVILALVLPLVVVGNDVSNGVSNIPVLYPLPGRPEFPDGAVEFAVRPEAQRQAVDDPFHVVGGRLPPSLADELVPERHGRLTLR